MKRVLCVLAGLSVVAAAAHVWRQTDPRQGVDLVPYYDAARLSASTEYSAVYDREAGDETLVPRKGAMARAAREIGFVIPVGQFYNPPICMLLFRPLACLSFAGAYRLVVIINLLATLAAAWMCARSLAPNASPTNRWLGFCGLALLAYVAHPVWYNTVIGNISLLLALGCFGAYLLDASGFGVLAGGALGLTIVFKPIPVLLLLFFALRRRWRVTISTVLTVGVLMAIGVAWFGLPVHERWLSLMRFYANHSFASWNNQSIIGGLLRFCGGLSDTDVGAWRIIRVPMWVIVSQRVVLLAALAWWLLGMRRWRTHRGAVMGYGSALLLMILAAPFAWSHYFVIALWPTAVLAMDVFRPNRTGRTTAIVLLSLITLAWVASPEVTYVTIRRWSLRMDIGPWLARTLVSQQLAAAIAMFTWLQVLLRRAAPTVPSAPISTSGT